MPVKTKGDAPRPRVGHASAMADRIMLVWGGDTKVKPEDPQDEGLYILDLRELALVGSSHRLIILQEHRNGPVYRSHLGR